MLQSHISSSMDKNSIENDFRSVLDQISKVLGRFEVQVKSYQSSSLKDFSKLSVEAKKIALKDAGTYLEVLMSDLDQLENNRYSEGQSLWLALRYFGLRPTSDVFEVLTNGSAIELYSSEGIQLWRNFKVMDVCSYTLEEIFCYTWQERYERDENATNKIMQVISQFSSENPCTVKCSINNTLKEKFSEQKLVVDVHHEHLSPVFNTSHKFAGFIVSSSARIVQN